MASLLTRARQTLQHRVFGDLQTGIDPVSFAIVRHFQRPGARRNQQRYCRTYVGITGSCGKSTTTYLTSELLSVGGSVRRGIFWGVERGILHTLRKLDAPVDYVVQEISGHFPGAIDRITGNLRLDVAVVTAVGRDHRTNFPAPEDVAREKGKLVAAVGPGGIACLNADEPLAAGMASLTTGRVVLFGRAPGAHVRASAITCRWPDRLAFDLEIGDWRRHVQTRFVGTVQLSNILAAIAVAHGLGIDLDAAIDRLETLEPRSRRMAVVEAPGPHIFVADTFKASLWSTGVLARDLANWGDSRKIFVLGNMADLGNDPRRRYTQTIRELAKHCDLVIGTGNAASGAEAVRINHHPNVVSLRALDEVKAFLDRQPPSLVILKSNRNLPLESVLPAGARIPEMSELGP